MARHLTENDYPGKHNLNASVAPTAGDDSGDGYVVGSRWINTTNNKEYVCVDNTATSAVWIETTAAGSGSSGLATKSGVKASGDFSGAPDRKATVTFSTAFSDANYSVSIIGVDSRLFTIESQVAGSFVINTNAAVALTGNVYWIAIAHGES